MAKAQTKAKKPAAAAAVAVAVAAPPAGAVLLGGLDAAASELAAAPSDLGRWLTVCRQLLALEARDDAARAYAQLGEAASNTGQVSLAVACAWWLRNAEARKQA